MSEQAVCVPPWERFSQWVHCICVITFDLELGQVLEVGNQPRSFRLMNHDSGCVSRRRGVDIIGYVDCAKVRTAETKQGRIQHLGSRTEFSHSSCRFESSPALEKMNICYLAFPDSHSSCTSDERYHFRIRRCSSSSVTTLQSRYRITAPHAIDIDPVHYYGFVHFRQQKDPSLPRGYYQKVSSSRPVM
jgi:hypothetical protein